MPSIRIGFSTDLNLVNEQVGIGTTNPTARLDVRGQIRADNSAGSGGISTLTRYDGFLNKTQSLPNNVSIAQTTKGNLNSLSGEIVIDGEITVEEGTALTGGRLDSLTVTGTFDIPHGGSEDREETPEKGSTRFNQDLGQLEFYTGYEWRTVGSYDGSGRGRGVFGGGTPVSTIDFVNIHSKGNAISFGNLSALSGSLGGGYSSSTRGIFTGGSSDVIEYITIASEGNAIDFGNLSVSRRTAPGASSSTRGLLAGGYVAPASVDVIDYVEIATIGNALDFGDLSVSRHSGGGSSSSTRGVFVTGWQAPSAYRDTIDYVTIASKGNAVDFGNYIFSGGYLSSCSNSTRSVSGAGYVTTSANKTKQLGYITIATTGNAINFGELTEVRHVTASCSTQTRGLWAGGVAINTIDFISINTLGDAQDFGDLTQARYYFSGLSDSHGGLGGF